MAEVVARTDDEITLQVKVKLKGSMLDMEDLIQQAVNEVGAKATEEALEKFDTTGAAIQIGDIRLTSKGQVMKRYETPYGAVDVTRHVYQTSTGGKTYCPLDEKAHIVTSSTPRFAKIITHKYTGSSAREVSEDLEKNHGRRVARSFLQNVVDFVGSVAQATEESWMYAIPKQNEAVATVAFSLDGTCILMRKEGYREAMAGTISLYNKSGERLHTIYLGASPEYGKQKFLDRLEREIYSVKLQCPDAKYVGIADGAKTNWEFLEKHTSYQILDFYHATEYLTDVADAVYPHSSQTFQRKEWLDNACHHLKHDENAANHLLKEMMELSQEDLSAEIKKKLTAAITYFKNQKHRMCYEQYRAMNLPIGSGVTEAACKTLVKQRLCQSAMKWGEKGARLLLCLRALVCTPGRFEQFWERINLTGFSGLVETH
jgi:hypothetical protein